MAVSTACQHRQQSQQCTCQVSNPPLGPPVANNRLCFDVIQRPARHSYDTDSMNIFAYMMHTIFNSIVNTETISWTILQVSQRCVAENNRIGLRYVGTAPVRPISELWSKAGRPTRWLSFRVRASKGTLTMCSTCNCLNLKTAMTN